MGRDTLGGPSWLRASERIPKCNADENHVVVIGLRAETQHIRHRIPRDTLERPADDS